MSEQTTKTVAEEALEVAQWLGDGQGVLARLQETHGYQRLLNDTMRFGESQEHSLMVSALIREAVEHFGRMP